MLLLTVTQEEWNLTYAILYHVNSLKGSQQPHTNSALANLKLNIISIKKVKYPSFKVKKSCKRALSLTHFYDMVKSCLPAYVQRYFAFDNVFCKSTDDTDHAIFHVAYFCAKNYYVKNIFSLN